MQKEAHITIIEQDFDEDDELLFEKKDEDAEEFGETSSSSPMGFVAPTAGSDAKRAEVISKNPVIVSVATAPPPKNIVDDGDYRLDAFGKAFFESFTNGKDLTGQVFRDINLRKADLSGGDFTKVDFTGSDLSRTSFRGSILSGAVLKNTDLSGANLRGADLSGADLRGVDLSNADLSGANLKGAKLDGAIVANTGLMNASMDDAVREDLRKIRKAMRDIDLANADLTKIDLRYVDLRRVDLRGVDLSSVDLTGVNLVGVNLSGCKINPKFLDGTHAFKPGPGRRIKIAKGSLAGADFATKVRVLSEREEAKKAQTKAAQRILENEREIAELIREQKENAENAVNELVEQREKQSAQSIEQLDYLLKALIDDKTPVTSPSQRPAMKVSEEEARQKYIKSDEKIYRKSREEMERRDDKRRVDELIRIAELQEKRENLRDVRENVNERQAEKQVEKQAGESQKAEQVKNALKNNDEAKPKNVNLSALEQEEEGQEGAEEYAPVSRKIASKGKRVRSRQKGKIRT
jgi:uncharacterized protein YjbI with pentapeptide repeats